MGFTQKSVVENQRLAIWSHLGSSSKRVRFPPPALFFSSVMWQPTQAKCQGNGKTNPSAASWYLMVHNDVEQLSPIHPNASTHGPPPSSVVLVNPDSFKQFFSLWSLHETSKKRDHSRLFLFLYPILFLSKANTPRSHGMFFRSCAMR